MPNAKCDAAACRCKACKKHKNTPYGAGVCSLQGACIQSHGIQGAPGKPRVHVLYSLP